MPTSIGTAGVDVMDTDCLLFLASLRAFRRAVGTGEVLPGREVEEVLPVRPARPRFQLRQFFLQLRRPVSPDERGQLILSPPGRPGKDIDDGMGVRGDEVDRSFRRAQPVQHTLGRKPPLVRSSGIAKMAAADHLHRVALATLRHEFEVSPQSGSPDAPQPLPIRWLQSQPLADRRDLFFTGTSPAAARATSARRSGSPATMACILFHSI